MKLKHPLKSKEAIFLASLLGGFEMPKHPIMAILYGQLSQLLALVDGNEEYQKAVSKALTTVKEKWNDN